MIDETAWQTNKVSQCHSHTVGHGIDQTSWHRNKVVSLTTCLSGCDMIDETVWQTYEVVSLTDCW